MPDTRIPQCVREHISAHGVNMTAVWIFDIASFDAPERMDQDNLDHDYNL